VVIASGSIREAEFVQSLLVDDFPRIELHIDDGGEGSELPSADPSVLVLAFKELESSEQFYLSLYRCGTLSCVQHRTVVLCAKEHCARGYELCRRGLFDDYVLFWPVTNDPKRLLMSVHRAFNELARSLDDTPLLAAFAEHARRLVDLEALLAQQMQSGQLHIESANRAVACLEAPHLEAVRQSLGPLAHWAANVVETLAPQLESARTLGALANEIRPTILIVEDDEFQRRLVGNVLESENYRTLYATSGLEALRALARVTPDLILMDLKMPDIDGVEVMRRCRSMPRLAGAPVIMVTGNAEMNVVLTSRELGVADFIVKPFDRKTLLTKISRVLEKGSKAAPADKAATNSSM
jgi:CheY-like chemotaxis protein